MMQMSLKELALVLLSVCVATAMPCTAVLNETQTRVVAPAGSDLVLCYRLESRPSKRVQLAWHFNPNGPSFDDSEKIYESVVSNMSNKNNDNDTFQRQLIRNITHKNSGWYFCSISADIPKLEREDCEGTQVFVQGVSVPFTVGASRDTWWLWVSVGVLGLVILVLVVPCVLLTRQRKHRERRFPIYMNTHPRPRQPTTAQLKVPQSSKNLRTPSPARGSNSKQSPK
ncbi:uncharacterized protein LOC133543476 isoform X3 [Nerophis ophidion]|uniref:uncharacterized protein LOC133543476 isoform X3 n=1 Tax=Nerophis ophidion TaxID=159077 RepID=UPI002ADF9C86|nr:uncharacterized protein LOC133543476 isoform X3 [Nerophis ophidion]